jgi:hypothetical protein
LGVFVRRFGFRLVVLIFAFAGEASVDAQAAPVASVATAAGIAEKARRAFNLGHAQEAIEGFSQAYEMSGEAKLLFDIAEAHRALGHQAQALRMYQNYLRRDPDGQHREMAKKQIRELESGGQFNEHSTASTAPVATPLPRPPGPAPAPARTELAVRPAQSPPATTPAPQPWPASSSPLMLAAEPAPTAAPTGVDLEGKPAPAAASSANSVHPWIPWALAGTTIALGAGAIVYGRSASSRYDDLSGSCGQTSTGCTSDQVQEVKSRAFKANVLWALAGLAAVGTGVVIYVDARDAGLSALWTF